MHMQLCLKPHISKKFIELLAQKVTIDTDVDKVAAQKVYDEMVRKLCNTRIQEILSSLTQKITSCKRKWHLLDRIYLINY